MKTQITVEIPDGYEITSVMSGEPMWRYENNSEAILYTVKVRPAKPFIINGAPSDWPEWLLADWVAKDEDGKVWAYHFEPRIEGPRWVGRMHEASCLQNVNAIDIPGPWEQSLRENPRRKK